MLNIEKYADEIKKQIANDGKAMACVVQNLKNNGSYSCQLCTACEVDALNWLLQEYKEPILTDEEKVIIKNIIKAFEPFGKKLSYIAKKEYYSNTRKDYLVFRYKNDSFCTLDFNNDELFEGMESDVDYTLDELGL